MKTLNFLLTTVFLASCNYTQARSLGQFPKKAAQPIPFNGKSNSYFRMSIAGNEKSDGTLQLIADITLQRPIGLSQVRWQIPPHLILKEGELTKTFDFSQSPHTQVSIVVGSNELRENDQIFLFVTQNKDGEDHGSTTSYIHKLAASKIKSQTIEKAQKRPKIIE